MGVSDAIFDIFPTMPLSMRSTLITIMVRSQKKFTIKEVIFEASLDEITEVNFLISYACLEHLVKCNF